MTTGLLSLKWNNHRSTFFHVLATIRQKESYCDVTLACDGKFYSLHKFVLSTCSEYFEEMFERTQCKHPVIVLKDIKSEEFEALLNYMYVGEVNVVQEKLGGLIKAAECLKIKGLAVPDENPFESESGRQKRPQRSDDSPKSKRKRRENSSDAGEENITNNNSNSRSRQKSRDNSFNSSYQPKTSSNNVNNDSNSRELTSSQERSRKQSHKTEAQPEPITLDEDIKAEPAESEECYDGIVDSGNNDSQPLDIREGDEEEEDSKDALHQELGFDPSDGGGGGGGADYEELDPSLLGEQHMQSMDDMNQSGDYQQNSFSMWEGGDNSGSYSNEGYAGDAGGSRQMMKGRHGALLHYLNQHTSSIPPLSSPSFPPATSTGRGGLPSSVAAQHSPSSPPHHQSEEVHYRVSYISEVQAGLALPPPSSTGGADPSVSSGGGGSSEDPSPLSASGVGGGGSSVAPLKLYECVHCSYSTGSKNHMHYHVRKHTGVQPYCCPVCGQRFSVKSNLSRHVRTKHKDATTTTLLSQ